MTETSLQDLYQRLAQARAGDRPRLKKRLDGLSRRFSEHGRDKVAAAIDISVAARERRRGLLAAPLQWPDLPVVRHREELAAAIRDQLAGQLAQPVRFREIVEALHAEGAQVVLNGFGDADEIAALHPPQQLLQPLQPRSARSKATPQNNADTHTHTTTLVPPPPPLASPPRQYLSALSMRLVVASRIAASGACTPGMRSSSSMET